MKDGRRAAVEIEVQFQSRVPITEQIAHRVMELIAQGTIQPGEQLPTTRSLAVELGVNFNTVARAYRILDRAGIISTQPGRGTFILDPEAEEGGHSTRADDIEELARNYIRQASHLGFEPEEIKDSVEKLIGDLAEDPSPKD
ncbi:MAG: GntR family transcriptional regulator [Anaerolineales bacterium]